MGRTPDFMYIMVVIFLAILLLIAIFSPFHRKKKRNSDWERKSALWFQELMRRFQERFPDQPFHIDESDPFTIEVPPKHSAVVGLRICDGGSNIMVEIGPFTHRHFNMWGPWVVEKPNLEELREAIVVEVLLFVEEIFEDKIEFYGGSGGGGHRERGKKPRGFLDKLIFGKTTYVWSGPIQEQ